MVTRYTPYASGYGEGYMCETTAGDWVSYEDYAELELAHKAAMLTINQITDLLGESDTLSISQQVAELVESNKWD